MASWQKWNSITSTCQTEQLIFQNAHSYTCCWHLGHRPTGEPANSRATMKHFWEVALIYTLFWLLYYALIPSYLLHISCDFSLPSKHKLLGKTLHELLTFLSNYYFTALYCKHLYVLQGSLATNICKHLFFYVATNVISFHIQHTNSSLKILSSTHSHNPLRYHHLPTPSN